MARTFSTEVRYPMPPEQALAMMRDPAWLEYLLENSGGIDPEVAVVETDDDGCALTLDRGVPAEVPSFIRSMVGDHIVVREQRVWGPLYDDDTAAGTLTVGFDGTPMRITGDLTLAAEGEGSLLSVSGSVSAGIPLVGGKVEGFALDQLLRFTDRETELAADWQG